MERNHTSTATETELRQNIREHQLRELRSNNSLGFTKRKLFYILYLYLIFVFQINIYYFGRIVYQRLIFNKLLFDLIQIEQKLSN